MVLVTRCCHWRVDGQMSMADRLGEEAAFPRSLGRSNVETDVVIGRFLLGSMGGEPIFRAGGQKWRHTSSINNLASHRWFSACFKRLIRASQEAAAQHHLPITPCTETAQQTHQPAHSSVGMTVGQ
ncbi:hypothetical protein CRENBAI_013350 [Crenichthys baileyi]|uniref:Uncharacterized protein n=1 Tax=Crenichthys baileyi TaxID=28760 RepID=A0AAV9R073_9TELE